MRRAWASLLAVWATLAIVAVLAWSHRPPAPVAASTPQTVVVRGVHGARRLVVVHSATPPLTMTHSSTVAR